MSLFRGSCKTVAVGSIMTGSDACCGCSVRRSKSSKGGGGGGGDEAEEEEEE